MSISIRARAWRATVLTWPGSMRSRPFQSAPARGGRQPVGFAGSRDQHYFNPRPRVAGDFVQEARRLIPD